MKILAKRPPFFTERLRQLSVLTDWQGKMQAAGAASVQSLQRIKTIGFTSDMDDYEKRKLGIFNQLNFFQLVTWVVIPVIGALSNRHFPLSAWIIACMPACISILVMVLNARCMHDVAKIAYFVLYPLFTSIVYAWGINMG